MTPGRRTSDPVGPVSKAYKDNTGRRIEHARAHVQHRFSAVEQK